MTTPETPILRARGLGRRYGRRWALSDCDLDIPAGRVVGLVGPNGAGKTTLLSLAAGLLTPTAGTIEVCGGRPAAGPDQLAKVGFVAQDAPVYARLTVAEHLELGARLNPRWDSRLAGERIRRLGLPSGRRAGNLSGGQRAQLALTLAVAKRPELLVLDEPVAALDPLARREFLQDLADATAGRELSVVHSSHLVSDVERVCDHIVVLVDSRVRIAGGTGALLAAHRLITGPATGPVAPPPGTEVVSARDAGGRRTMVVRTGVTTADRAPGSTATPDSAGPAGADGPAGTSGSAWTAGPVGLEDLVLAYMGRSAPALEAHR